MRPIPFAAATLLTTTLLACAWNDCVTGEGPVVKRSLEVTDLHGIRLEGSLDVIVTQGSTVSVEAEGQANVIDLIETKVSNGIWTIRTRECYRTDKILEVHVQVPTLTQVEVLGSGEVSGKDPLRMENMQVEVLGSGDVDLHIVAERTTARVKGSGDIRLKGSTTALEAQVTGSGDVKTTDLVAQDVVAEVTGSGDVEVHAGATLKATVTGSGDIRYAGSPALTREVIGSGDISPAK